jgi:Matrixin
MPFAYATRHRSESRRGLKRAVSPVLEGLETRLLLYATTGGQWAYGSRITYSFIPDGTSIGGTPSNLFQTLNASFATDSWQAQIEKAAAVWEAVANISLAEVSDNGTAIAAAGNQQGDTRFGDIRIGGMTQASGQLAMAYMTPPYNGGTLAGDIFFNTTQSWQINGAAFDLETVAIHEFGHALGMGHSQIAAAVMYAYYNTTKQTLTADDISGIQSIYGPSPADAFDAAASNNTFGTATVITPYINASKQVLLPDLSITGSSDSDFYYAVAPTGAASTMTVSVQSTNLSSLSPSLWVYNSSLQFQGKTTLPASYGATATFTVSGVTAGQGYYFKVVGADYGASGQGNYGLLVNFGTSPLLPIAPPYTVVAAKPDQGGGASPNLIPDSENESVTSPGVRGRSSVQNGRGSYSTVVDDSLEVITVGTISGYADALSISQLAAKSPKNWSPTGGIGSSALLDHSRAATLFATASFEQKFVSLARDVNLAEPTIGTTATVGSQPAGHSQRAALIGKLVDRALFDWHSHGSI